MAIKRSKKLILAILIPLITIVLIGNDYFLRKLNQVERSSHKGFYFGLLVMDILELRNEILSIFKNESDPSSLVQIRLSESDIKSFVGTYKTCLLYTSPSPRDLSTSRMPSSA